jgi:hypothetical protein
VVFLVKVEVKHQKMVGRMMLEVEVGQMSTMFKGGLMQVENQVKNGSRDILSGNIHRKKRFCGFPSPAVMSLTKLFIAGNIFPL